MDNLAEKVEQLNLLIVQFRYEEALEKFYDENIISHENETPPIIGLDAYKKAAKEFIKNVSNYSASLLNVIISDDMSVVEWHYMFDHKGIGKWDRRQLSLQRWKNGKIIHERHHWNH